MLDLYLASSEAEIRDSGLRPRVSLEGENYWFLYRYFTHASLSPGDFSFLSLYEDTELSGYQIRRLSTELREALADLSGRPRSFPVFVGWNGQVRCAEAEEWRMVDRAELESLVSKLLSVLDEAAQSNRSILALGD